MKVKKNNQKILLREIIKKIIKNKKMTVIISLIITSIVICGTILFVMIKTSNNPICMVRFETNGGSEILSQDVKCGKNATTPPNPTKEGFLFEGWYYNGNNFDFNNTIINENIILAAKWKVEEGTEIVKIHFDTDGGSSIEDIEISKGSKLIPPINPSKEGYTFTYWYLEDNRFDFLTQIDKNITLKAGWKIIANNQNNVTNNSETPSDNSNNDVSTNKKCTYEMKDVNEYGGIPTWRFEYGNNTEISSFFGFWNYDYETCEIKYKTDDNEILSVSSSGLVNGKKLGTTNLYICVIDKKTRKELDCFQWYANVDYVPGSEIAKIDSNNILNAIVGHYWYLDGYKYAYIHADVISDYENGSLNWSSKYIEIIDNNFVTSEDTGKNYGYSSNIHNEFLINPTKFAYDLISKYNMHVKNDKLYITLGGKTYSFTKNKTEKNIIPQITLDKNLITVDENQEFNITATIQPSFFYYSLTYDTPWIKTNNGGYLIATCNTNDNQKGKIIFNCKAIHDGKSIITIKDVHNGTSKTIDIAVNNVPIRVKDISLNKETLSLYRGTEETLIAKINPLNADDMNFTWASSDTNIATVNSNGKVVAKGEGTVTITATTNDGQHQAHCVVTVTNPPLTAKGTIGYSIINTGTYIYDCISATLNPIGGSGRYVYYHIKLYKNGVLIRETTDTDFNEVIAVGHKNGTYTMEYVVRDSYGSEFKGTAGPTIISMQ